MNELCRRDFIKATGATGLGLLASSSKGFGQGTKRPPNLVYVFTDQQRVQAMGFMGEDPVITPNLDAFAKESKVLFNAVSNNPLCSPYRAMLLTGRWQHETGVTTNCNSAEPDVYLRKTERCISDVLADAGYSCGYIGKWHLDTPQGVTKASHISKAIWDCYSPLDRRHGFTFWHAYGIHFQHLNPYYWINDATEKEKTFYKEYSPVVESRVAADFIENKNGDQRKANAPFALFVSMHPPHTPFNQVPKKYKDMYKDQPLEELLNRPNVPETHELSRLSVRDYFAAVTGVDDAFGEILKSIERSGEKDNTIVVFSADHGEMMGSHGAMEKNLHWDESFRIPFMIRQPGVIAPGMESLHMNVPDNLPTLLNLMGMQSQIPKQVSGTDHADILRGTSTKRPTSAYYTKDAKRGIRTDRYTFVCIKTKNGGEAVELYDNEKDKYQLKNVAGAQKQMVEELRKELDDWAGRTKDPWLKGVWKRPFV